MSLDPLSDVLRLAEARSVLAGGFSAGGRWALHFPPPDELKFCAIIRGTCWLRIDGRKKAHQFHEGDVGLLPAKKGFTIGSDLEVRPREAHRLFAGMVGTGLARINDGSDFFALAGGIALHPSASDLLGDVLPEIVAVRAASPRAAPLRWIVEQLEVERTSTLPGTNVASAQLAQLLFVQILRVHLASDGALRPGWLRAIRDERLAPALRLIHAEPERTWALIELAKACAMSRTAFAVHFKSVTGVAPLTYLAEWRMRLAQRSLREEKVSLFQLAESLGYASESAFSTAFKRITGVSPRTYRTTHS